MMSHIDEATENPNDKMPEGKPLDSDFIVPDGDAELNESDEGPATVGRDLAAGDPDMEDIEADYSDH